MTADRDRALLAALQAMRRPPLPARAGLPPAAFSPPDLACPAPGPGAGAPTRLAEDGGAPARHPTPPPTQEEAMIPPSLPAIPERVTAGATLLDRHERRWWRQVDPARLDLADPAVDVLGQLYGQFEVGLAILGEPDPVACGFDLDSSDADADYPLLTQAWQQAIWARHAAEDREAAR
jgi:hypothetical protein